MLNGIPLLMKHTLMAAQCRYWTPIFSLLNAQSRKTQKTHSLGRRPKKFLGLFKTKNTRSLLVAYS